MAERATGFAVLFTALAIGCGGGSPPPRDPADVAADRLLGVRTSGGIELTLRRADGTFVDVGELRGEPLLLFVFATFDTASQMQLTPLRELLEARPDFRVVGIAAQPGARMLVDAYEHALSPPFPITYDPEDTLVNGTSALGTLEGIPTLVLLDANGLEVARHQGFLDRAALEAFLAPVGR